METDRETQSRLYWKILSRRVFLKMVENPSRFVEFSSTEIDELLQHAAPRNTKKATKYEMKIFNGR